MASELDQLRQEAENLKCQIRVRSLLSFCLPCFDFRTLGTWIDLQCMCPLHFCRVTWPFPDTACPISLRSGIQWFMWCFEVTWQNKRIFKQLLIIIFEDVAPMARNTVNYPHNLPHSVSSGDKWTLACPLSPSSTPFHVKLGSFGWNILSSLLEILHTLFF